MTKSNRILIGALSAMALVAVACSDDEVNYPEGQGIVLEMPRSLESGGTFITLTTQVWMKGDAHYTKAGYCIGETPDPTVYGTVYEAAIEDNSIVATIVDLAPNTVYHVRAFVNEYGGKLIYSDDFTVNTAEGTLNEQLDNYRGPKYPDYYVDLAGWNMRSQWNLANVHDPSVVKADDGYYYMYQTDASYGNAHTAGGHFHGRRSKDLVNWEYLGGTMASLPEWVVPKLNEIRAAQGLAPADPNVDEFGYWAPVVRKVKEGLYRMYYSIVVPGTINGEGTWGERSFIGVMENSDPANNDGWEDKGYVITTSSDKGADAYGVAGDWANCPFKFNAIDPGYVITDNGEHWLVYGSWHSGIAAVQVNAETGKPENLGMPWGDISGYGKLIATRAANNRWQASEGPEVVYRNGYYYLFLAYDALDVAYNTRVVRSTSITGPYVGIDGTDVTTNGGDAYPIVTHPYKFANNPGWVGISHCAVFDDGEGNWYYASQGRFPANYAENPASNAVMLGHVRSIRWTKDGWPVVMPERYGAVPKVPVAETELTGDWEHIDLGYSYGQQKESSVMTLLPDHTVGEGTWKGSEWAYDEENQILTVNGVDLYIARECDWESVDRHATIVYSGINGKKTYWGKKTL